MENKKNTREISRDEIRAGIVSYKMGAVWNAVNELDVEGIVNFSKFCEKYLQRTGDWVDEKLEACMSIRKEQAFTLDEYAGITKGLRELASKLQEYAEEIDSAKDE